MSSDPTWAENIAATLSYPELKKRVASADSEDARKLYVEAILVQEQSGGFSFPDKTHAQVIAEKMTATEIEAALGEVSAGPLKEDLREALGVRSLADLADGERTGEEVLHDKSGDPKIVAQVADVRARLDRRFGSVDDLGDQGL